MKAETWTTRSLREWTRKWLGAKGVDSPQACTDLLLASVLGCDRMDLYSDSDRPASPAELARLRELVTRAGMHEPVQYLVGSCSFFTHTFEVDRSTLIPRPSTETLVTEAVQFLRQNSVGSRVLDLCTGTGCVAISIAAAQRSGRRQEAPAAPEMPSKPSRTTLVATDISEQALQLASRNAHRAGVAGEIQFLWGDLYQPLQVTSESESFGVICANPPYISDRHWQDVPRNVRDHEPESALRGGEDGLKFVEPIIRGAPKWLQPGGLLLVEIAFDQGESALKIASETGDLCEAQILKDCDGLERVLRAQRQP